MHLAQSLTAGAAFQLVPVVGVGFACFPIVGAIL